MKRFLGTINLVLALVLLFSGVGVALASFEYYIPISIYNNSTEDYTNIPILVTINSTQLADLGYIDSNGLNTDLQEGAASREFMVGDARLGILLPSLVGNQQKTVNYRLGDTTGQTGFPIMVGDSGNITASDDSALEIVNNGTVEFDGVIDVDPGSGKSLIYKPYAFDLFGSDTTSGNITLAILNSTDVAETLRPNGAGDETNIDLATGTPHYSEVNDGNDATYVYTESGTYLRDLYVVDNYTSTDRTISSVIIYFRILNDYGNSAGQTSARPALRTYGTSYNGTVQTVQGAAGWSTKSQTYATNPYTGVNWTWDEVNDLEIGVSLAVTAQQGSCEAQASEVYIEVNHESVDLSVSATGVTEGSHVVLGTLNVTHMSISVDGSVEDSVALGGYSIPDNSNTWFFMLGGSSPYADSISISVNGTQGLWYEPNTMVIPTNLPDRSGNGNTGTINWGGNPSGIEVTIGGLNPYESYITPGGEETEPPIILPEPTGLEIFEDVGATGQGLPLFGGVSRAAASLGWTTPTTYVVLMLLTSIGFGFGAMVATGTIWGFIIGFGGSAAAAGGVVDSGGYHVFPWWLAIACVMFAIFLGYVWRHT